MLSEGDKRRIARIIEVSDQLQDCIERNSISRDDILRVRDIQWMLSMPLADIAEQVYKLSPEFKAAHPNTPWKYIAAMRHRLVHGYEGISFEYVADAVFEDVPELRRDCFKILQDG